MLELRLVLGVRPARKTRQREQDESADEEEVRVEGQLGVSGLEERDGDERGSADQGERDRIAERGPHVPVAGPAASRATPLGSSSARTARSSSRSDASEAIASFFISEPMGWALNLARSKSAVILITAVSLAVN